MYVTVFRCCISTRRAKLIGRLKRSKNSVGRKPSGYCLSVFETCRVAFVRKFLFNIRHSLRKHFTEPRSICRGPACLRRSFHAICSAFCFYKAADQDTSRRRRRLVAVSAAVWISAAV